MKNFSSLYTFFYELIRKTVFWGWE